MELIFRNDLNTELTQKLTLTPELIQSLNILQFGRGELLDYIYDMMLENPVLEFENHDVITQPLMESTDEEHSTEEASYDMYENSAEMSDAYSEWDAEDWYNYAESRGYSDESYYGKYTFDSQENDYYNYSVSNDMTLEENLLNQAELSDVPYITKATAVYIIQTIDENGYLTCSLEEIADELGISEEEARDALRLVQSFDPAGVGASDLSECLELQLRSIGRYTEALGKIIRNHLEDIASNRLHAVAKATGLDVFEVQDYADMIRSLEPKPGRIYATAETTNFIIPDVSVENINGEFKVNLNSGASPKVIIRSEYRKMLRDAEKNSGVAAFLSGRFNTAMWLVRSIEQRNETILKVSQAIADRQREFLLKGKGSLKPMSMKEIAEELGIHESTVSRAVNGKYMQSSQGVYELRYFFTASSRFSGANAENTSSESIKVLISRLVEAEDRKKPMSDRAIAEAVSVTGVEISRRTVTKYREELGIPSSSVRRRVK